MKRFMKLTSVTLLLTGLYGCGGGGGNDKSSSSTVQPFPAGKTTLSFSAMSTARLAAPVSGIDVVMTLPGGMSVATATGGSGQIADGAIATGSGLGGTSLVFGVYSASTRKAYLSMVTSGDAFRSGEFLRLTCDVSSNTNITLEDVRALNSPLTILKAVGYDTSTTSTITQTDKLKVTIGTITY